MWSKLNLLTSVIQASVLGIGLWRCVENSLKMNKLIIKDRFDTTIKVADKFNALDDLHISLTVKNDLMSIPVFLSKEQVKELINHLQKVIENE
jgi:hypothetical protein